VERESVEREERGSVEVSQPALLKIEHGEFFIGYRSGREGPRAKDFFSKNYQFSISKKTFARAGFGHRVLPMKTATMTLSKKRQSVFPADWCEREGLAQGGMVNVIDLGPTGLLIRPLKPPPPETVAALLAQPAAGSHSPKEVREIVERALRKVRSE
jgi:bifunctional DNA-binding transcriptional regulator/antitoxin component of YhaV-PrlF toxin-antitoxin module